MTAPTAIRAVPRLPGDARATADALAAGRPVVLAGLARAWPAVGRWTPAWFARTMGGVEVALHAFTRRDAVRTTLGAFARTIDDDDRYLAWDGRVLAANPALAGDIDLRALFPWRLGFVHAALWMGGRRAFTPLHHDDGPPNLHAVVSGTKRFRFFAPTDSERVYPADVYEWSTTFSAVDLRGPDLARHPRFAGAVAHDAVLEPGDVVFVPPRWWHAVWCLEPAVSVNGWWMGPRALVGARRVREAARFLAHKSGVYRRGRCTCCGHGDLRRHLGWES